MRRVQSATAIPLPGKAKRRPLGVPPRAQMPPTANKRRRRNSQQRIRQPLSALWGTVLSPRWISLALLAATIYALVLIGRDPRFYLTYIPVEGTSAIVADDIVARSGLAGSHIFAADPQGAAERIAELPGVISATVTLRWPNNVVVGIREETPVAVWREGNQAYWINEDGQLLPALAQSVGLLEIVSEIDSEQGRAEIGELEIGEGALDEGEESEQAAEQVAGIPFIATDVLAGAIQLRELRPNINQLYYRPSGGLSYQDGRGWRVYFGSGQNMHQKLVVYETLVEDLLSRGIQPAYIGVSNQERPYYRASGE
jgi:hypothetical protein